MNIDIKKLSERILSYYKNNIELIDMSEFERGYFQALCDIQAGKFNKKV